MGCKGGRLVQVWRKWHELSGGRTYLLVKVVTPFGQESKRYWGRFLTKVGIPRRAAGVSRPVWGQDLNHIWRKSWKDIFETFSRLFGFFQDLSQTFWGPGAGGHGTPSFRLVGISGPEGPTDSCSFRGSPIIKFVVDKEKFRRKFAASAKTLWKNTCISKACVKTGWCSTKFCVVTWEGGIRQEKSQSSTKKISYEFLQSSRPYIFKMLVEASLVRKLWKALEHEGNVDLPTPCPLPKNLLNVFCCCPQEERIQQSWGSLRSLLLSPTVLDWLKAKLSKLGGAQEAHSVPREDPERL